MTHIYWEAEAQVQVATSSPPFFSEVVNVRLPHHPLSGADLRLGLAPLCLANFRPPPRGTPGIPHGMLLEYN